MFSDDELEQAVLHYLTSDVTTSRSEAGMRDTLEVKRQIYEIISAAFMLRPSTLFSVCWLASNALYAKVVEQLADLEAIIAAAPRVSVTSARVESVTDLRNAEAALVSLTAAFSARRAGVAGGIGPAIQRFHASVERFMREELAKNVVAGGDIVKTAEQLRLDLATRWAAAKARHAEIAQGVLQLTRALEDYSQVRLPDTVVGSLLARIQARLVEVTAQMAARTAPEDSRAALLELTAMRVLLRQAAQFRPPALKKAPLPVDSASGILMGATGSAAALLSTRSAPFDYTPGAVVAYRVGEAEGTLTLPTSTRPAPMEDVVAVLQRDARLRVSVDREPPVVFIGRRGASTSELVHVVAEGSDLATEGTSARAGADLAAQGVAPGMWVALPDVELVLGIEAVDGPVLTLASPAPSGTFAYWVGPDYQALRPGAAVQLSGTTDAGWYRLLAGGKGRVLLDRALADATPARAAVLDERIRLEARDVSPTSTLMVLSGEGALALGLVGEARPALERFDTRADLGARGVVEGDQLVLEHAEGGFTSHAVLEVAGTAVRVTPPVPYEAGLLRYAIYDARVAAYEDLCAELVPVLTDSAFTREAELDQTMGRLARGARYSASLAAQVEGYRDVLAQLALSLAAYQVPRDPALEQAVRMLVEHGFDRALDLLLGLQLSAFFALDADGVSYRTWVVRSSAEVARRVVPVSRDTRDPTATWRTVAVQPIGGDERG